MDNLSPKLSATLRRVYENRNQDGNYYINLVPFAENPVFTNERPYSEMAYPDAGFRLMSLFRYWSSVEYFFPEKYQTDKPWSEVLREYIPVFIEAKDELEYEIAALRIIGEICDSHATLWRGGDKIDSLRGNNYAPFRVQFVENKLIVTDYYNPEKCTLDIGDVITEIDGRNVEAIVDSLRPYYPASNESARLRDMSEDILRARDNKININGQSFPLYPKDSLNMYYLYKVNMGEKSYKMLDDNIGYITLANIQEIDVINIKQTFINTRGIVIDMRNYPLSVVMYAMGNWFAAEDKPFIKFSKGSVNNPSAFYFQEPSILTPPKNGLSYNGKVVVLVNEITQSQAECTAMAFQAGSNTTIIGSQTAGADGNVSTIVLPGGLHTMISGRGAYYPDGAPAQRIGIVPDIEVKPTIKGIREGRDELLDKAIEVIKL